MEFSNIAYVLASVLFILGIKKLSHPKTARNGNSIAALGMLIAIIATLIFNENIVGPDVSWIVPLGFKWNKKYKFDLTARGHNTRIPEPESKKFFGWNDGDAVGLVSYQFLHNETYQVLALWLLQIPKQKQHLILNGLHF